MKDWQKCLVVIFGMALVILFALLLTGCKAQQPQVVEKIITKTEYIDRHHYDSIYIDKVEYVDRGSDTIIIERVKTEYRYKLLTDSIEVLRIDSIPYEVERIVKVNKLNDYQKTMITLGWLAVVIIALRLFWRIYKVIK